MPQTPDRMPPPDDTDTAPVITTPSKPAIQRIQAPGPKPPAKIGRPPKFTPELIDQILEEIVQGASEKSIFDRPDMPTWSSWGEFRARQEIVEGSEFPARYAKARELKYEAWEKEIIVIANDTSRDYQPDGKGGVKSDNTSVNRDRLRVDTMKWLMSKMMPKKYGDKLEQEIKGEIRITPVLNFILPQVLEKK